MAGSGLSGTERKWSSSLQYGIETSSLFEIHQGKLTDNEKELLRKEAIDMFRSNGMGLDEDEDIDITRLNDMSYLESLHRKMFEKNFEQEKEKNATKTQQTSIFENKYATNLQVFENQREKV